MWRSTAQRRVLGNFLMARSGRTGIEIGSDTSLRFSLAHRLSLAIRTRWQIISGVAFLGRVDSEEIRSTTLEIYRALYTSVPKRWMHSAAQPFRQTLRSDAITRAPCLMRLVGSFAGRSYACTSWFDADGCSCSAARDKDRACDVVALNDPFAGGTHLPDVTW